MHPQTDCELIAYNEGVRIARTPFAHPLHSASRSTVMIGDLSSDAQHALDVLGPDVFWSWADRGYYSHTTTSQQ